MNTVIQEIEKERQEQIEKHGRSSDRDLIENGLNQLSKGAAILSQRHITYTECTMPPTDWSQLIWEKMCNKPYRDRLIIAAALLCAEVDRLDLFNAKYPPAENDSTTNLPQP